VSQNAQVTYWQNIFSESLYRSANIIPVGGSWSAGAPSSINMLLKQTDAGSPTVGVFRNLMAHCSDRNPEVQGLVNLIFAENVIFDWGKDENNYPWGTFFYWESPNPAPTLADVMANVYIAGPVTGSFLPLIAIGTWNAQPGTAIYLNDNIVDQTMQPVTLFDAHGPDPRVGSPPVSLTGIPVMSSALVKAFVLAHAGARPNAPDAVDTRIKNDVVNYTGDVITSQSEVGGWPTLAVNPRPLTIPTNPHGDSGNGYTNLEVWLQGFAAGVE